MTFIDRFWAKVRRGPGCWEWTGSRNQKGYGNFYTGGGRDAQVISKAHRVAYEAALGPVPSGSMVLHHCDNPPCVKTEPDDQYPDGHLFLGSAKDNADDREVKGRGRWRP